MFLKFKCLKSLPVVGLCLFLAACSSRSGQENLTEGLSLSSQSNQQGLALDQIQEKSEKNCSIYIGYMPALKGSPFLQNIVQAQHSFVEIRCNNQPVLQMHGFGYHFISDEDRRHRETHLFTGLSQGDGKYLRFTPLLPEYIWKLRKENPETFFVHVYSGTEQDVMNRAIMGIEMGEHTDKACYPYLRWDPLLNTGLNSNTMTRTLLTGMGLGDRIPKKALEVFAPGFNRNLVDDGTLRQVRDVSAISQHTEINRDGLVHLVERLLDKRITKWSRRHSDARRCRKLMKSERWRAKQGELPLGPALGRAGFTGFALKP